MDISLHAEKLAIRTPFSASHNLVQCFRGVKAGILDYNCPVDFLSAGLQKKNEPDIWHLDKVFALCTDESAPLIINGECIGSNHGHPGGVVVESLQHGKTLSDIGSFWRDDAGVLWSLLRIESCDRLFFLSENLRKSETDYEFKDEIAGNLSYVSHGENKNPIIVNSQYGQVQIYRAVRYIRRDLYYYKDGIRFDITGYHTDCDMAEIVEEYEVINPATVAESLRLNRPDNGYDTEPDLATGERMMKSVVKYQIQKDGTVICDFQHTRLQDVQWNEHMGIMYQSKCDLYEGGIYRYIPKTLPIPYEGKSFDFSVPFDSTKDPYPNNVLLTPDYFSNPDFPPDRQIDFIKREEGSTSIAFTGGFLPVFDGAPEIRKNKLSKAFLLRNTRKTYPYIASGRTLDSLHGVGYKKYFLQEDSRYSHYTVSYGDKTYIYLDIFTNEKIEITVDIPKGFEASLFEKSQNVSYTVEGDKIKICGSRGYAVFINNPNK